ncbi:hypothetical protein ACD591_10280 [Rufibacter glacialis]|uniref:Uncharacterized protein n=1 Tax=Rufibacter glacialis TaxID=1259555 RepID=A0ABV4RIY7_9BACT|nr:hypothetical protein [Rufibacter glacialis]
MESRFSIFRVEGFLTEWLSRICSREHPFCLWLDLKKTDLLQASHFIPYQKALLSAQLLLDLGSPDSVHKEGFPLPKGPERKVAQQSPPYQKQTSTNFSVGRRLKEEIPGYAFCLCSLSGILLLSLAFSGAPYWR